jgi:hypothetical protein
MKTAMNNELINHLKNVSDKTLIGLCIQQLLLREGEAAKQWDELKAISREFPEIMIPIIGQKAYSLLMNSFSDLSIPEYYL